MTTGSATRDGASAGGVVAGLFTRERVSEVLRFAVTGLAAYLTDILMYNVFRSGAGMDVLPSTVLASFIAIGVAFAGSRWYTWRDRRSDNPAREYLLFLLLSVIAAAFMALCPLVSLHVLGLESALADNVSRNVVGMGIATVFRFVTFRKFVFPAETAAR